MFENEKSQLNNIIPIKKTDEFENKDIDTALLVNPELLGMLTKEEKELFKKNKGAMTPAEMKKLAKIIEKITEKYSAPVKKEEI